MKKKPARPLRLLYIIPAAVVVLILALYLGRGWIRGTFEPVAISVTAGRNAKQTLDEQLKALNSPFKTLGINTTQSSNECRLSYAKKFHSQITCSATTNGFAKLSANQQTALAGGSASLEKLLKSNGWSGMNTSITTLGTNISKGIDYTPDAAYQKTIGKITCVADFNTAFSRPRPAAINGSITCVRVYEILGSTPQVIFPG